jgi:hypothetical protein
MLMLTKRLANQAFEAIAPNGVADHARGDRKSKAGLGSAVGSRKNGEQIIGGAARLAIDAIELGFLPETLCRSKRPCLNLQTRLRTSTSDAPMRVYTVRRLRPFARRRAMTWRPARVAMRARNP